MMFTERNTQGGFSLLLPVSDMTRPAQARPDRATASYFVSGEGRSPLVQYRNTEYIRCPGRLSEVLMILGL